MQYRRLGRTNLHVSAVGFGTCQLRRVPEQQGLDTLARGFALGVNLVHTAPDYEGADDLVAEAVRRSGRDIIVLSQGYGDLAHFEWLFESACRRYQTRRLPMFGIACIDDREYLGEPVWGPDGVIAFLQRKQAEGRLGGIFCTTHGTPDYIARLIRSGVFDAVMLAYNALGFHLLSYHPSAPRAIEDISRHETEIFPLARRHGVGLLVMKPLAGGLLCGSLAFPRRASFAAPGTELRAGDILRDILRHPDVSSVVPGTASVEEAEENARAGHDPGSAGDLAVSVPVAANGQPMSIAIDELKASLCSRCGACDALCSQHLPISWLFRDAYISHYPGETFETDDQLRYFRLHPSDTAICSTCPHVTCACPYGIDIPASLTDIHTRMLSRRAEGLLPDGQAALGAHPSADAIAATIVSREIPQHLSPGARIVCRIFVQNIGAARWITAASGAPGIPTVLDVHAGAQTVSVPVRHDVEPGTRTHFVFEITAPAQAGSLSLRLRLRASAADTTRVADLLDTPALLDTALAIGDAPLATERSKDLQDMPAYGVEYLAHRIPERLSPGATGIAWVHLRNTGRSTWRHHHPQGHRVDLVLYCDGEVAATHHMPQPDVHPGDTVTLHFPLRAPDAVGRHTITLDLVEQGITFFAHQKVAPLVVTLDVDASPPTASERLYAEAAAITPWHYQPTRGIHRGADGRRYPLFVSRAQGCHVWDLEGRRYIDYVMGWGSALLGYNDARIREAIVSAMACAPVVPLPQPAEIAVARALVTDIPCAEMVMFGKNGSDVCTLAARVARAFTGRTTILYSGYHGWGDWWVEQAGFAATGVPDRPVPLIHPFRFNDLADFTRLFAQHRQDLAAVMLEPAGPGDANGRIHGDADAGFLAAVATMTREAGALLIYDEIMTGFRYPGGSAQQATNVVPDLACFGKALAAGMPLSALVGRAHVLTRAMDRTHYGPTYRGESYSLAAAAAALEIYRREPVAAQVWQYGERLRQGVHDLSAASSVRARLVGPPFRMGLVFDEPDQRRRTLQRTLFHQELLKDGILTYDGIMLPSYAHDDEACETTLKSMGRALAVVATASAEASLERGIEIPLLVR